MTTEIPEVAERLAQEFPHLPPRAVLETVCTCAGECGEDAGPLFVEQAARARLGSVPRFTAGRSAPA